MLDYLQEARLAAKAWPPGAKIGTIYVAGAPDLTNGPMVLEIRRYGA